MVKILIVEDEEKLARFIELELKHEGYEVIKANNGRTGLDLAENSDVNLVLLDIMLPEINGLEVLRRLRKTSDIPIIMLTARDAVMDKVSGLDAGADDYITKPFAIEELLARIEVVFRRENNLNNSIVRFKDITININSRTVKKNNNEINLTNKEYELLMVLIDNKNKVVTREELLEKIWGYNYDPETNVIDVYIRYLRTKLSNENKEEYIQTVRSVGYIMRS